MKEQILKSCEEVDKEISSVIRKSTSKKLRIEISGSNKIDVFEISDKEKLLKKGVNYISLMTFLKKYEKAMTMPFSFDVACFLNARFEENRYAVKYAIISTSDSYTVTEKGIEYETVEIYLTPAEYSICRETGIGLYDSATETIFPFKECSLPSIGRVMDAEACYKYLHHVPLGSAMLLAEKLFSIKKDIKLIYLNNSEKINPIINIGVTKTQAGTFKDYFEEVFDKMAALGIYTIHKWEVTNLRASLTLLVNNDYFIKFTTSNMMGVGESNNIEIYLPNNLLIASVTGYRTPKFNLKEKLNEAVKLAEKYIAAYNSLSTEPTEVFLEEYKKEFLKSLGKKRINKLPMVFKGSKKEVFEKIVENYNLKVPLKQSKEVSTLLREILLNL